MSRRLLTANQRITDNGWNYEQVRPRTNLFFLAGRLKKLLRRRAQRGLLLFLCQARIEIGKRALQHFAVIRILSTFKLLDNPRALQ